MCAAFVQPNEKLSAAALSRKPHIEGKTRRARRANGKKKKKSGRLKFCAKLKITTV